MKNEKTKLSVTTTEYGWIEREENGDVVRDPVRVVGFSATLTEEEYLTLIKKLKDNQFEASW